MTKAQHLLTHESGVTSGRTQLPEREKMTESLTANGEVEFHYLLSGRITYIHGVTRKTADQGSFVAFWGGIPHGKLEIGPNTDYAWLRVPLPWVLRWNLPNKGGARLVEAALVVEPRGTAAADDMDYRAERWDQVSGEGPQGWDSEAVRDIHRRMRLVGGNPPSEAPHELRSMPKLMDKVVNYVAAHHAEKLSAGMIGKAAELHPNYLMQAFKRATDMSLWEYVLRMRVAHAARLLTMTDLGVLEISTETGFGSTSQFYEAFNKYAGTTPGRYRRQYRRIIDLTNL